MTLAFFVPTTDPQKSPTLIFVVASASYDYHPPLIFRVLTPFSRELGAVLTLSCH
jgi:hypothetical protein